MTAPRKILLTAASAVCFLWNLLLLIFLMSSSSGATAVCCFVSGICASGFLYIASRSLLARIMPVNTDRRRTIFTIASLAVCFVIMVCAPYAPAHDSMDMADFLTMLSTGNRELTPYAEQYLSFYGTNRVCLYMYLPFVTFFADVKLGSCAANVVFLLIAAFCISDCVYKKYGTRCGEISLFVLPQLLPYMMMSGPYIYPPSVFLSALAMSLFLSRNMGAKALSAVLFGLLTVMRPTSAAFWMILMASYLVLRGTKNMINNICFTIVLVLICLCTKSTVAELMYENKMYPYPAFTNSALEWTLELGLRPQGDQTGKCTYTALGRETFDDISRTFAELWDIYERADDYDTYKIKVINNKLRRMIIKRAADTVFSDFESLAHHLKMKYKNMFSDEYRPYYYAVNITDERFADNLYKNYEWRYFLSENVILAGFAAASCMMCVSAISAVYRKKRFPLIMLCTSLSVMAVFMAFVLLTEVGKRLIFDMYTPMCIIICAVYAPLIHSVNKTVEKDGARTAVCTIFGVFFLCSTLRFYSMNNAVVFKNAVRSYTPDGDVIFTLDERYAKKGYILWMHDGSYVYLDERHNIYLPIRAGDRKETELIHPYGAIQTITNYDRQKIILKKRPINTSIDTPLGVKPVTPMR